MAGDEHSWHALLLDVGSMLFINEERVVDLVVHVRNWGVLLWRLRHSTIQGNHYWTVATEGARPDEAPWRFFGIGELSGLKACRARVPSRTVLVGIDPVRRPGGLLLEADGQPRSLAKLAAERCFVGLHTTQLGDLLKFFLPDEALADALPTTEKAIVMRLLRHLLPDKMGAERDAILELRHKEKPRRDDLHHRGGLGELRRRSHRRGRPRGLCEGGEII